MTAPATVTDVAVDPDLARRLSTAGKKAEEWKPRPDDRVRELVKAGALIAAEIDRLRALAVARLDHGITS